MDDPTPDDEIAKLRIEHETLYRKLASDAAEAQREFDVHEEKRRLKREIAEMKRGHFPGPPPSEHGREDDDD